MSQPSPQSKLQNSSPQNSSIKSQQNLQNYTNIQSDGQNNPEPTGQKRQQDNDYQCKFKLTIKEKYQQKLQHDQTDCVFTVIINQIVEQRIRTNYFAEEQTAPIVPDHVENVEEIEQQINLTKNVPSQLDKLKAEDEQVKKRIKDLMKKRPKKKGLTYELDPNRDKGFILAKKMNEIKQQREKKYIQTKKQLEKQKNQLIQSQMSTIVCIQNFSMHLARKANRRYTKQIDESYKLPKIPQQNNFMNETNQFNRSRLDFLGKNKSTIDQTLQNYTFSSQRYDSIALSARSNYESVKKDKKRDLLRQIEILRKSQKITEKYQTRKMACDILIDIIFNAVRLVETKKEFYFNAPPKPVHQMIRNYKDKNGKTVWIPGSKPDKFRVNIHLKQIKKERPEGNKIQTINNLQENAQAESRNQSKVKHSSEEEQVSQTMDQLLNKKTDKSQGSVDEEDGVENDNKESEQRPQEDQHNDDKDGNSSDQEDENNENLQDQAKESQENQQHQSENQDLSQTMNNESKLDDNAQDSKQNPQIQIYL